jgi:hypothetical protein
MQTLKEQVKEMLEVLPEDVTYDHINYNLFVREKIDKENKDIEEAITVKQEEMETRFKKWLER